MPVSQYEWVWCAKSWAVYLQHNVAGAVGEKFAQLSNQLLYIEWLYIHCVRKKGHSSISNSLITIFSRHTKAVIKRSALESSKKEKFIQFLFSQKCNVLFSSQPIKADSNKNVSMSARKTHSRSEFLAIGTFLGSTCLSRYMHARCTGTISNSGATKRIMRRITETNKNKCFVFSLASRCDSSSCMLHRLPCVAFTVPLCVCICFEILRIVRLESMELNAIHTEHTTAPPQYIYSESFVA